MHLFWLNYLRVILNPLFFIGMDKVLFASLLAYDDDECNMPHVYENASMCVYPLTCDDMSHDSLGVVKCLHDKFLKKRTKKFHEKFSKLICEKDD